MRMPDGVRLFVHRCEILKYLKVQEIYYGIVIVSGVKFKRARKIRKNNRAGKPGFSFDFPAQRP